VSVNDIIDKIRKDSQAVANGIVAEARGQAGDKMAEAQARADEIAAQRREQAERDAESARVRALALARLAARDAKISCKQRAVDRVFLQATQMISAMDSSAYAAWLEKLLVERADGEMRVEPARADAGVLDVALVERANAKVGGGSKTDAAGGPKATLSLGEPTDEIERGFLLRTGRIVTDCSIVTLVAEARERYEADVYERLFGGDGE